MLSPTEAYKAWGDDSLPIRMLNLLFNYKHQLFRFYLINVFVEFQKKIPTFAIYIAMQRQVSYTERNGFFVFNNTAFFKRFWFELNNKFSLF